MSSWIDRAKDFIRGNPDKARDALEKAEDMVNERTGGKYAEHVDKGSDMVSEQLGLPPEAEATTAPETVPSPQPAPSPEPAPSPGPAPVPSEGPTPTPTPTEAGPTGAGTGTAESGGALPDVPSEGDVTLGDPPPAPPSR